MAFKDLRNLQYFLYGFIFLWMVKSNSGQVQSPVLAVEKVSANLAVILPAEAMASDIITIRLNRGRNATDTLNIFHVITTTFAIRMDDSFKDRVQVSPNQAERKVEIALRNVMASDGGMIECYVVGSSTRIDNCGQMLIVLRKPSLPTIEVVPPSSALVGSNLRLECKTNSTSMPPKHGLPLKIFWRHGNGAYITSADGSTKVKVNAENQLEVTNIRREDNGVKFTCEAYDDTGGRVTQLVSDQATFTLVPEFKPTVADLVVSPDFLDGVEVKKKIGEVISFRCDASSCQPACEVTWMFKPASVAGTSMPPSFGEVTGLADRKLLSFDVERRRQGDYQCEIKNKHGTAKREFKLNVMYMAGPNVSINNIEQNSVRIVEDQPLSLECVFDCNPAPTVRWVNPRNVELKNEIARGPQLRMASHGVLEQLYTSSYSLKGLKCEDTGIYQCSGKNEVNGAEGRMDVRVMCPPTSANIESLELNPDYVWEIPYPLSISFVIRAMPEPKISRIMSLDAAGRGREEKMQSDMHVDTQRSYDGKAYLTQFSLNSRRPLDLTDIGREFTLTIESTEFKRDFKFTIRARGPPHQVFNVTAQEIRHDSLLLFWRPGFDGGETQTFTVARRVYRVEEEEHGYKENKKDWTVALENIPDRDATLGNWIEVRVTSLQPSTQYVMRVIAYNELGNSTSEIIIKTGAAPDTSSEAGIGIGVIFAILIILILFIIGVYVYRRKYGKGEKNRFDLTMDRIVDCLTCKKGKEKESSNGPAAAAATAGAADRRPKPGPIAKMRNLITKKPKRNSTNYASVPGKDDSLPDDDYDSDFDDDYIDTEEMKLQKKDEVVYENTKFVNNNAESDVPKDSGRQKNEDGLVYVSVDFSSQKPVLKDKSKDKKKKKKKDDKEKNDRVEYTTIDFTKTPPKEKTDEEFEDHAYDDVYNGNDDEDDKAKGEKVMDVGIGTAV